MSFTAPILTELTIAQFLVGISYTEFYAYRTKNIKNGAKFNLRPYVKYGF